MTTVTRAAMALAPMLLLAACATGADDAALVRRAQTAMVGMPKAQLLSCAGVPARQATADGAEFYTYVSRGAYGYGGPSTSLGVAGGSGGVGLGIGLGFPLFGSGTRTYEGCEATVVLGGDIVRRVTFPPGADPSACAPIVQNCVPVAAPAG
ncbi:hypothetical protein [Azospirillum sp. ST 5-10]|uniref:hypothetical protein n=1 Tax=unclassified Azospirillum TaxID=2630922 RepID=UPI003F49EBAD